MIDDKGMFMLLTFTCGRYSYAVPCIRRELEQWRPPPLLAPAQGRGDCRNHPRLLLLLAPGARLSGVEAAGISRSQRAQGVLREELHAHVRQRARASTLFLDRQFRV